MHPMKMIGSLCARQSVLEKGVAWLGHHHSHSRLVSSLCYHVGEEVYLHSHNASNRVAVLQNGTKMSVTLEEHAFRQIYFFGHYEPEVTALMKLVAAPGQTWLDVGGNIGYYTLLLASLVGPGGSVHVFEPNPAVADRIEESVRLNAYSNVKLVRAAVSDTHGEQATLYVPTAESGQSGQSSLIVHQELTDTIKVVVPTVALDTYVEETKCLVDFMKIDIEGLELLALKGMQNTLRQRPPKIILCEVSHFPDCLATPDELIAHLMQYGYIPYRIRHEGLFLHTPGEYLHPQLDMNVAFTLPDAVPLLQPLIVNAGTGDKN